jgi:tetratricopeptide (TPR) repeat protein
MSYMLEIVGRGLLAELQAAFRDQLAELGELPAPGLPRLVTGDADRKDDPARRAVRALHERRPMDAQRHFERVLAEDPANVQARLGLACALDECGDPTEAAEQLMTARAIAGEDPAILFGLGFCLEKAGRCAEAENAYRAALVQAPHLRNGHERLATLALRRADIPAAIAAYEQLCWYEPGEIDLHLTLAGLYLQNQRTDDAIRRFQHALTIDPDNWDIQNDLVTAYADAGQYERAIAQLAGMIADEPHQADHQLRLGDLCSRVGDLAQAREAYEEAIRLNPDYLEAHIKLGTARLRDGEYAPAADAFNHAVELNDRLLTAYVGLGVAFLQAGQTTAAEDAIEMAAGVEPSSTMLFSEMARLQLKASINDQTERYLAPEADAVDAVGEHAPTRDLIDEQIHRHQQALVRHPHYADLHYRLGMLLRHRGRLDEAVESFHQAIEINPNYVKALIKVGLAHVELGQFEAAVGAFRRALSVDPSVVELHYRLGLIFADRGHFSLAVEQFEHAVMQAPDNVEFRANLAWRCRTWG